ncbi:MAG: hypothetical protein WCP66_06985 [Methylococcales bacterium]
MAQIEMILRDASGNNPVTIKSCDYSEAEKSEELEKNKERFYTQLENAGFHKNTLIPVIVENYNGVCVKFFRHPSQPSTKNKQMKDAVKSAVELVSNDPDLRFPDELLIFFAEEAQFSVGYLYKDGDKLKAGLMLGATSVNQPSQMNRTVSQEVYNHYKPAWTVDANTKLTETIVIHELGHMFHQMKSLEYYFSLAKIRQCSQGALEIDSVVDWMARAPSKVKNDIGDPTASNVLQFFKNTKSYGTGLSNYAYNEGLNEFVAETFAALVIGSPIGSDQEVQIDFGPAMGARYEQIMEAYQILGGPLPSEAARHKRKTSCFG